MPRSVFPISQREITITRSAIRSVVKDLLNKWAFPKDANIVFNELQGAQKFKNGKLTPCNQGLDTDYSNYIFVDYEERYAAEGYKPDTVIHDNHQYLFNDRETGVFVKPHYATMIVEASLRFRARDLTSMTEFRNSLKFLSTERHVVQKHNLFYDYNIPDPVLFLTQLAYKLRESKYGSGITMKDYFQEHFKKGVTKRYNQTMTFGQPVFEECQQDIVGILRDSTAFNIIEVTEGIYEVTIPYEFYYQQPIAIETVFPLFIHNQFVGKKVLDMFTPKTPVSEARRGWNPREYLGTSNVDLSRYYLADGGTRYVEIDDFYPNNPFPNTQTITLVPIKVSEEKPNHVINLNDLPKELLPEGVIDYLKEFWRHGGKMVQSLIHIEIFEIYGFEMSLDFKLDEELNVSTYATLDPRHRLYLRVSVARDWSIINNDTIKEIIKKPELVLALAKLLDKKVELHEAKPTEPSYKKDHLVVQNRVVTVVSLTEWLKSLPFVNQGFKRSPSGFMGTVGLMNVNVHRRKN